ncbi:hypothetical protein TWF730_006674 [Orbilia blumenaviensis]|uniref:Uncharacterized protein n=1 Tax=Orbilia blumenaviensis TaxID=1796055 RepID=A0AAV9VFG3_9PEZI
MDIDQPDPIYSDPPLPAQPDRKRPRLSVDVGVLVTRSSPPPTQPGSPPARLVTPPRKPWPTRLQKDDIVSLEDRLRYLESLVDDTSNTNIPRAQRRVDELRHTGGSLASIHVTESLRTSVTQEDYGKIRDEEIRDELHRDQHRKVPTTARNRTRASGLSDTPEDRIVERMRAITLWNPIAVDEAARRNRAQFEALKAKIYKELAEEKEAKSSAPGDQNAARNQATETTSPLEYSEGRLEQPKLDRTSGDKGTGASSSINGMHERITVAFRTENKRRQEQEKKSKEEQEEQKDKSWIPK